MMPEASIETETMIEIPGAPRVPHQDVMIDISLRVAHLSDTVNDPNGSIARRFARAEEMAIIRHDQQMRLLQRVFDEAAKYSQRFVEINTELERLDFEIRKIHQGEQRPAIEIQ